MQIRHLHPEDFKTSRWSGGTTTELFLYPPEGNYQDRAFLFRISSATVDTEESNFTPLPGVERYITPLSGSFVLSHPNGAQVKMPALSEPYRFSGETATHCVGKATDFNLMLKNCKGRMELCVGQAPVEVGFNGYFAVENCLLTVAGQDHALKKGEMLTIFSDRTDTLLSAGKTLIYCKVEI